MKEDYSGEKFLSRLFKDLYLSSEVQNRSKKNDKTYEAIKKYMDKLKKVHSLTNTENKKDFLKEFYFRKYVIKEENIPFGIRKEDRERIIANQKKSLSLWIDYLTDENARYPMWAKYWAFQGMLKLGTYDDVHGVYQRRSDSTIAPFVEANPAIIANCINNMISYINNKQTLNEEVKPLLETGSFKKLYEYYKKKLDKEQKSYGKYDDGKWIKYNEGSREEAHKLYLSLQNKGVEWCTASEETAIDQVCGARQYVGGDFYVYYTLDENNEYSVPRIAIRMDGHDHIGEIRGVAENQNLEEEMIDILEAKLHEMSFVTKKDIDKNIGIVNGLRELYEIYRKTVKGEELIEYEITSLYTKKYGFGWQNDPVAKKTIDLRIPLDDIKKVNDIDNRVKTIIQDQSKFKGYKTNNKTELLKLIKNLYHEPMQYASDELRSDKEVLLEAVKRDVDAIKYASTELRGDKDFILQLAKQNGYVLEFTSDELRGDKETVMYAVSQNGNVLQFASAELRSDKEVVLEAVKRHYTALQYASEELKSNKEFILQLVKQKGYALEFASEELRNDKEVVLEAVKEVSALEYASDELRNDKDFALQLVKQNEATLLYVSEELRNDKEVVLEAVKQNGDVLEYASDELRRDKEIVLEAVKRNCYALEFASEELRNDKEVVLEAVKQNGDVLEYASVRLRSDKGVILEAVKRDAYPLQYVRAELRNDKDFALQLVKQNGKVLKYASVRLRSDKEVVLEAVKQNINALEYADADLLNNKSFLKKVFANKSIIDLHFFIKDCSKRLPEIVIITAKECLNEKKNGNKILRKFKQIISKISKHKKEEDTLNDIQEENIDDSLKL